MTMTNQNQFFRQTAAVLLACGLIAGLLPGFAAQPDSDDYEARKQWVIEATGRDSKFRTDGQLEAAKVLARLCLSNGQDKAALEHTVTAMEAIAAATDPITKRGGDIGGQVRTAAPALVRILYKFGNSFNAEQLERIKRAVSGEVFTYRIRDHGTENHAMDFVSALYLLPQYFPDAIWKWAGLKGREFAKDGRQTFTSQQMMDEARDRILRRGRGFYRTGHAEQLSTTYDMLSARSSCLLWEFARDPVVRDAGEALTVYHVGLHALNGFDGHTMPPFNRRNGLQARSAPDGRILPYSNLAARLFWGLNERIETNPACQETMDFAISSLRIPEPLNRIARGAGAPYEIRGANGQFGYWGQASPPRTRLDPETLRYVWRDRDFAIGGPVGVNFNPAGYFSAYHMFNIVWKSKNRLRALEAMHPYWYSNSKEKERVRGEDYWRTTNSPFQQFGIHRNVAITMFNIPDKDPWSTTGRAYELGNRNEHFDNLIKLGQVRFPSTVEELTKDGDFYFFREGGVYVAIRVLKPGHTLEELEGGPWPDCGWQPSLRRTLTKPDIFHVIKSREARTGFVFEVSTAEKHGSFGAFQQAMRKNPLVVDWGKLEVSYTSTHGNQLRFRYDTDYSEDAKGHIKIVPDLWINGKLREVDFDLNKWPLAESPVMTMKGGILRAEQGGNLLEVDWSGELPRISRR
jgi:hypothetical protein